MGNSGTEERYFLVYHLLAAVCLFMYLLFQGFQVYVRHKS